MRVRGSWPVVAALFLTAFGAELVSAAAVADPRLAALDARIDATKARMMGDPAEALVLAGQALAFARALPPSPRAQIGVATAEWLSAWALISLNRTDKAKPLVDDAFDIADRIAPRTKLQGDLLRARGSIAATAGRMQEALQSYRRAYAVFTAAHETRSQAIALQDMGQIYKDAGDYPRALAYYAQMAETYRGDHTLLLTGANDRAEVVRRLGRAREAEDQYRTALREARVLGSPVLETRVLANLAVVEAERGEAAAAQRSVDRAMLLTGSGEAMSWRPLVLGTAATVAHARGDEAGARRLFDRMFAGVDLTMTDMQFREFHRTASDVYSRSDRPDLALAHLVAFHRLEDSARDVTASIGAQLMSARFDFANQNLRISTLRRGQLERDYKLVKQRSLLLTAALGAGAVLLALLLFGTLSLRRSRNKLEKALAAKTEFLATTSHEIRTPLNGILGMAQVLLARDDLDGDAREKVQLLHGAGQTMRALIDDILDVAKMERGDVSVLTAPTRLQQLLLDTGALWRGHAEAKGLELRLDIDVPASVLSDESRLRQIVSNLLSNAVKFTERGAISLSAKVDAGEHGAEMLDISVTDSGIGIPADQRALVFDAFHQVDGATTRQFNGTGLGLAICRRLALAFGGSLVVESEEGVGSTFRLRLPLLRADPIDGAAEARQNRPETLEQATVLAVGTNLVTLGILRSLLERHTDGVEAAGDFGQARAKLAEGRFHHLLVDASAQLQRTEGVQGIRALLARAGELGILTTLLISADGDIPAADLLVAGATQSVLKPVTGDALLQALRGLYSIPADFPRLDQAA